MNKKLLTATVVAFVAMLFLAPALLAAEKTFTVSATVPTASSVSIEAYQVDAASNEWADDPSGLGLSFNPLTLDTRTGNYTTDHYFAIDVGPADGVGTPSVTVTYGAGANPNEPDGHGLGWKSTATFVKVTGAVGSQTETGLTAHGPKKLLKDVAESITTTEISGGFLRIYLGLIAFDPNATYPDPANGETFTNADEPGTYDATVYISATL